MTLPDYGGIAGARGRVVDALTGIDGVNPTTHQPNVLHAGNAWPRWTQTVPLTGYGTEHTFGVFVVLRAGPPTAQPETNADELLPLVLDALTDAFVVDRVAPDGMVSETGGPLIPLLRFDIRVTD